MNIAKLSSLDMWSDWQSKVINSLPNFCGDGEYVAQRYEHHLFEDIAQRTIKQAKIYDLDGKEKDIKFGALPVETRACGKVTRMWLETNREIDFLSQNLNLKNINILDIGAGYGRLAVVLSKEVKSYSTVDAVEISTSVCRYYTKLHNADVRVMNLTDLLVGHKTNSLPQYDLAINIHSWSECSYNNVKEWLDTLKELSIPYLFTVTHGNNYQSWDGGNLKSLFEEKYTLVATQPDGISNCPYNLWKRTKP